MSSVPDPRGLNDGGKCAGGEVALAIAHSGCGRMKGNGSVSSLQ